MVDEHQRYRLKALASEKLARDAIDTAIKNAWSEIAIEWHALANRIEKINADKRSELGQGSGKSNV